MYAVSMEHITKSFNGNKAVDDVSLHLKSGEVMALLGENGAGKSTIMKILSGVLKADSGRIFIRGEEFAPDYDSRKAASLGIAMIHQDLLLCQDLTVAENIFLGRELHRGLRLDKKEMNRQTEEKLLKLGITGLEPDTYLNRLPLGKQQLVAIVKALITNAGILIMDEPTSSLSDSDVTELFRIINELKAGGTAIIYISHRLQELHHIADSVTIMRDGKFITEGKFTDFTMDQIIAHMVGRHIEDQYPRQNVARGRKILEVKNLSTAKRVKNASFDLYEGEVLGFAGLVGAGRTKIVRALYGADPAIAGEIILDNRKITVRSPIDAIKHGILLAPEDRIKEGLCKKLSIRENIALPNMDMLCNRLGIVRRSREHSMVNTAKDMLKIKMSSEENMAGGLSGGNQQKVVIGKWISRDSRVLIFDEPTKGIDVAAKSEIYEIMNSLKKQGIGIILISSELPEIMGVSDRILVMCDGRITGEVDPRNTTEEEIMTYATMYTDRTDKETVSTERSGS